MEAYRCRARFLSIVCLPAVAMACGEPAPERSTDAPAEDVVATTTALTAARSTYRLLVVNPMAHAMIVSVQQADTVAEMGSVPAGGELVFDLPVPPGATVTLIARDDEKTHSPTVTLTLPEDDSYATWTIE